MDAQIDRARDSTRARGHRAAGRLGSCVGLSIVTIVLGLLLGPADAHADSGLRKLVLGGIFRDGRAQGRLDAAILRRLGFSELHAERPPDTAAPPCLSTRCLPGLAAREHADLALGGELSLSDQLCSGTLHLSSADGKIALSRIVGCRPDWSEFERENAYSDAAGELVQDGLAALAVPLSVEPRGAPVVEAAPVKSWRTWNWQRKVVVGALAAVAVGAAVGAGISGGLDGRPRCMDADCNRYFNEAMSVGSFNTYNRVPEIAGLGVLSVLSLTGLLVGIAIP